MVNLFSKLLTLFVRLRYSQISSEYRFFIKIGYLTRIRQLRFLFHDFVFRKPYKKLDYNGELSPELKFVLPFAYWHHKNGTLKETICAKDTLPFYFFSDNHIEKYEERIWCDFKYDLSITNIEDHNINYSYNKWLQVPLKEFYRNDEFVFEKPILIISNKYNQEWDDKPINYLSIESLSTLFSLLSEKYQIIYNRPKASEIIGDNSEVYQFDDHNLIATKYPSIIDMSKLHASYAEHYSFNELQLRIYANSDCFISVQGGNSTLASYFGGTNIIYSIKGHEIYFKEYETIYPKLSNAKIIAVNNKYDLLEHAKNEFLK